MDLFNCILADGRGPIRPLGSKGQTRKRADFVLRSDLPSWFIGIRKIQEGEGLSSATVRGVRLQRNPSQAPNKPCFMLLGAGPLRQPKSLCRPANAAHRT